jgi:hypothetical protein
MLSTLPKNSSTDVQHFLPILFLSDSLSQFSLRRAGQRFDREQQGPDAGPEIPYPFAVRRESYLHPIDQIDEAEKQGEWYPAQLFAFLWHGTSV